MYTIGVESKVLNAYVEIIVLLGMLLLQGKVSTVLKPLILDTSIDLTAAFTNTGTREEQEASAKSLASVVENIIYFMTDIMV